MKKLISYEDNKIDKEISETHQDSLNWLKEYFPFDKNRRNRVNFMFCNQKMALFLKRNVNCLLCQTIVKSEFMTYKQEFQYCSNLIMPQIGCVNGEHYIELYDKYKYRIIPTDEMTEY